MLIDTGAVINARAKRIGVPPLTRTIVIALATLLVCHTVGAGEHNGLMRALDSITVDQLQNHVDFLADDALEGREAGSRGGRAAGHYLVQQFRSLGLAPAGVDGQFDQLFNRGYRNLLGFLEGHDPDLRNEIIVIGAHYDHVGYGSPQYSNGPIGYIHNGADDNASGTAAVLEIAEACIQLPQPPRRSILFTLWDGEEKGLLGSQHWLREPTVPLERVTLAINLDMVGRLGNQGLEVFGTRTSRGLRELVSRQNRGPLLSLRFPWQITDNSDHYSFFSRRIPFLMFHTGVHDDYHRPSDDAHKINREGMREITRLVMHVLYHLADGQKTQRFRAASRREDRSDQLRFERRLPPAAARLGVRWQSDDSERTGLVLTSVTRGSAADRSGLRVGDRIVRFAGQEVANGDTFRSDVLRAENPVPVVVERPNEDEPINLSLELSGKPVRLGFSWRENDAEPGVVCLTRIVPGSPAHRAGLRVKDRIHEVGGRRFADSGEFLQLATTLPFPLDILRERRGRLHGVILEDRSQVARVPPSTEGEPVDSE